ncbi:CheR family methyltransferase [Pseudoroseicyclus aestuarii]|uniref:Chemotaxis protein methyltransferase n=1 Tax=Pseudoroseicyclus aestuarii TaxID=1795041 RepID=A0A318STI9_9RHOB|nr:protein-glutamate O-methyltransferase [Pseudoroseicyclus aestuarii]PYE84963.1 chemotaxis protein methyltransferase CheR [Pseudoroseicyclus aestuarii]
MTAPAQTTAAPPPTGDFAFDDADFNAIARIAQEEFGLHLVPSKKSLVYSRLSKRLRENAMKDFGSYLRFLESDGGGEERSALLSALTTNVTNFFREQHHFDMLANEVLPPLIQRARAGGRVRLWSSACSSGQEVWSMAATLHKLCPEAASLDIRILATDIDPVILQKAKAARYAERDVAAIPEAMRSAMLTKVAGAAEEVEIRPELRALISFGTLNLISPWPFSGKFDVIFCRNVAIYFDKATQALLWHRFASLLPPGAHLMIGHSERVAGPAETLFASVGVTAYRRNETACPPIPSFPSPAAKAAAPRAATTRRS